MNSRPKLDALLRNILGSSNIYYQPPESLQLLYPAIIYNRKKIDSTSADNINYLTHHCYKIVVVDKDPDSEIVEKISKFKNCKHESHYAKDGLNYDIFSLYYD